jgi:hypothetical protein
MPMEQFRNIVMQGQYGLLQQGFSYDLRRGYSALVVPNNVGKSTILQAVFRFLHGDAEVGQDRQALILPDRGYVEPDTQTGSATLGSWNHELFTQLNGRPLSHASSAQGPGRAQLARVLMHGDLVPQVLAMNDLLGRLGLRPFRLGRAQQVESEDIAVYLQGSGLRGLLPILAALTNQHVQVLLIDEPEISLEPRLQKALRDLLIDASAEKTIVLSTHSHLFLNRQQEQVESNQFVTRGEDNLTVLRTLATPRELFEVTFDLLGSSTEDLFFPRNYIIVEGASDQEIVAKMLELLGMPTIKVLSAQGIDTVRDTVASVLRALVPLVVNDSPYAERVIALIDQPKDPESANVQKLRQDLGDRLYTLEAPSIEEYMPAAIYEKARRDKESGTQPPGRGRGRRDRRSHPSRAARVPSASPAVTCEFRRTGTLRAISR